MTELSAARVNSGRRIASDPARAVIAPLDADEMDSLEASIRDAVMCGDYTMNDGTPARYYVNGRRINTSAPTVAYCARALLPWMKAWGVDVIAGEVAGATPLVGALLTLDGLGGGRLRALNLNKPGMAERPGACKQVTLERGLRAAVIDDVLSSGATVLRCRTQLAALGLEIVGYAGVVDRCRGAVSRLRQHAMTAVSLFEVNEQGAVQRGRGLTALPPLS